MSKPPAVDAACVVANTAFVRDYANPVQAVQAAYNAAAKRLSDLGREPAQIEVIVRAAPKE
jgi:hypothetical protein